MPLENEKEQSAKLVELVRNALEQDKALREQYQIGDKFRFIRDRLQLLLETVEKEFAVIATSEQKIVSVMGDDEVLVYVHIYNAQGIVVRTWQKMLIPGLLYEYSINRPVYSDKAHIESFLRSKTPRAQHGYLTVAIKKENILPLKDTAKEAKDTIGNPLIKIKEGSLAFNKIVAFAHDGLNYSVNEKGEITKKPEGE